MIKRLLSFFKRKTTIDKTKFSREEILQDLINNEHSHNILKNKREDLIALHHSLGRTIRNEYGLWKHPWEPELRDGVDYSSNHPDSISQRLIESLYDYWETHPEELKKRTNNAAQ